MIVTQILVELSALTPVTVAAPERASTKSDVDLPISADAWGNPYLPTTGVTGSLRAHAASVLGSAESLLGADLALLDDSEQKRLPSAVRFLGTRLSATDTPHVSHQTAVSRWGGGAADKALRSREALPAGTAVSVFLCAEDLPAAGLEQLQKVLTSWRPVLGGSTSTGMGQLRVTKLAHRSLDIGKRDDLAVWLASDGPGGFEPGTGPGWQSWKPASATDPAAALRWRFRIASDLRVGAGKPSAREATVPLQVGGKYVIPGSSWKGVFRARAEYILRSAGLHACPSTDQRPCGHCPTCELFGWAGPPGGGGSRAKIRFTASTITGAQTAPRTHVAIDRFTGGARSGQLFTETVLTAGETELVVTVDPAVREWAEPLLAWVAIDIHDGFVGVGHGTARGMGTMQLVDPTPVRALAGDIPTAMTHRPAKTPGA
jgi:CRISPR/Cas system CSM-associated protein Csm3 (group 7 of RAMP superfamily)